MYNLLFVEDETATREGILASIPWDELGIESRSAKNGALAFELAQEFVPDILLTDIKMPKMNGIDLAHKIREINPDCSILMISGYSEVEYLKSAILLHAVNYVDKPIDIRELKKQIIKAVDEQREIKQKQQLMKHNLSYSLSYIDVVDDIMLLKIQQIYPKTNMHSTCQAFLLKIITRDLHAVPDSALVEVLQTIQQKLEEQGLKFTAALHEHCIHLCFFDDGVKQYDFANQLYQTIEHIIPEYMTYLCMGSITTVSAYPQSLQEATQLLQQIFYDEKQKILSIRMKNVLENRPVDIINLQPFSQALKENNKEKTIDFVNKITQDIAVHRALSPQKTADLYFKMLIMLFGEEYQLFQESNIDTSAEWLGECIFLLNMKQELIDEINRYFDLHRPQSSIPIEEIVDAIQNNYHKKEISLNQLSKEFYLSNVYLCVKFKEYTGTTFVRYLTELRIQKAVELLTMTNLRINEIAERTGFDNSSYFTKIFKKEKGLTPAEYRKQL